jgi:hypothetical protein
MQSYKSRKISPFEGWAEHFDKEVLEWIITETKKLWYALGYDRLLLSIMKMVGEGLSTVILLKRAG